MTISGRTTLKTMLLGIGLLAVAAPPALAQKGLDEPFQGAFKEALAGKTVAFVPVAMNFDLTEGWFAGLKRELEPYGVKVVVRDPNWSTNAGAQAFTALIADSRNSGASNSSGCPVSMEWLCRVSDSSGETALACCEAEALCSASLAARTSASAFIAV